MPGVGAGVVACKGLRVHNFLNILIIFTCYSLQQPYQVCVYSTTKALRKDGPVRAAPADLSRAAAAEQMQGQWGRPRVSALHWRTLTSAHARWKAYGNRVLVMPFGCLSSSEGLAGPWQVTRSFGDYVRAANRSAALLHRRPAALQVSRPQRKLRKRHQQLH